MAFSISAWRRWSASSFQGIPLPVGDEGVIAVVGEQRQLGAGCGPHPAYDEPHRRGIRLTGEGGVGDFGHVGGALHPVGYGPPVRLGYVLDQVSQAAVQADGDGEACPHLAADLDHSVAIEAAVGPYRELTLGPGVAHPSQGFAQEVPSAPGGVGPALAEAGHQDLAGAGGHGQQRVIAPLAGVAVMAGSLLVQAISLADGGINIDDQGSVAGTSPGGPGPGQQLPG